MKLTKDTLIEGKIVKEGTEVNIITKKVKEELGIPPILPYQAEYKDKMSGATIEFDQVGFIVEDSNGNIIPFEYKNMFDLGIF